MFETPDRRVANKRKTMFDSPILESPSGIFNSIRRQTIVTSTPAIPQVNDDEAERKNLKRMSTIQDTDSRASPSIPLKSLEEFIGTWVRMSVENKINTKNVWKIHIIDYLNTLLNKELENPLQIASASLGASAKVYSLRVDDVYSEVVKLAGELGRRGGTNDKEPHPDDEENHNAEGAANDGEDVSGETRKKQKKSKRKKTKTLANPDALSGEPDLLDASHPLFAELNTRKGDINGSNNMLQIFVPINDKTNEYDLNCEEKFFDHTPPADRPDSMDVDATRVKLHLELPPVDVVKNLCICPEFTNFSICNWSPEADGEDKANCTLNKTTVPTAAEIHLTFDIDAEPLPITDTSQIMDADNQNFSSDEEMAVQEEVNMQQNADKINGVVMPVQNIVDMRPSNVDVTRNLEYSYNSIANGIWAGPAHWKIKSIVQRPTLRISCQSGQLQPVPQTTKRKRTTTKLTNSAITYDDVNTSATVFSQCNDNKLKLATVSNWVANSHKNLLPIDLHIQVADRMRLFLNRKIKIIPLERPPSNISIENNQYDYNNLNDSNFCAPDPELLDEPANSDHEDVECNNEEIFNDAEQDEVFTGNGLIEAPITVPKTFIPYATRAKKVDMKKIKNAMWNIITRGKCSATDENKENTISNSEETDVNSAETLAKISIDMKFSEMYTTLPKALPPDQATNLSLALAFFALLHITNEHTLALVGQPDRADIHIKKG